MFDSRFLGVLSRFLLSFFMLTLIWKRRERETFENVLLLKVLDLHLVSVFVCGVISICRGVLLVSMDRLSRFSSLEMANL